MNKLHLRAAAEAFAGIDEVSSACYHYTQQGYSNVSRQILAEHYLKALINKRPKTKLKLIDAAVETALTELTYPVLDGKHYAWSGRERSALSGIPSSTWHRNELCNSVNSIIDDIRSKSRDTLGAIEANIRGQ